ncbi:MAG: cupredoxin domain-containing protein [Actinomycetota bacterium]
MAESPTVEGGQSDSFEVEVPEPGEYYFQCDFHPTTMSGTLIAQ